MLNFCTILSINRIHQGIALHQSLERNMREFVIYILCMDEKTLKTLSELKLKNTKLIELKDVENESLIKVKADRKLNEYCWTLKPAFMLFLFQYYNDIESLIYVDSDIYFYADLQPVLNRYVKWSVLLTNHVVSRKSNGGFVCFKKDVSGIRFLKLWEKRCLEWCYAINKNGCYGDQGHLDELKVGFKDAYTIRLPGVNMAPWNYFKYDLKSKNNKYYAGNYKLVFFHFSGLKLSNTDYYLQKYDNKLIGNIYMQYIERLSKIIKELEKENLGIREYLI